MGSASYLINRLTRQCFPTILIFLLSLSFPFYFPSLLYANNAKNLQNAESSTDRLPVFTKNRLSLQFVWGKLYSPFLVATDSPEFDYSQVNLRCGWMIDDPTQRKYFLRGNFEALLELTYSRVIKGPGNYLAGAGAMIRYNVVYPGSIIRPFIQLGGGIVMTDVHKDRSQDLIGQSYQFDLRVSVGLRLSVARNWSIDLEGMYNHISNGGLSERNDGVNAGGVLIGVTYFFDKRWQ